MIVSVSKFVNYFFKTVIPKKNYIQPLEFSVIGYLSTAGVVHSLIYAGALMFGTLERSRLPSSQRYKIRCIKLTPCVNDP